MAARARAGTSSASGPGPQQLGEIGLGNLQVAAAKPGTVRVREVLGVEAPSRRLAGGRVEQRRHDGDLVPAVEGGVDDDGRRRVAPADQPSQGLHRVVQGLAGQEPAQDQGQPRVGRGGIEGGHELGMRHAAETKRRRPPEEKSPPGERAAGRL